MNFDSRTTASASELADDAIEILADNPSLVEGLLKRIDGVDLEEFSPQIVRGFLESQALKDVLERIFEVGTI